MSEWISVDERLPDIPQHHLHADRPVLVVSDGTVLLAFLCMGKPTGHRTWDVREEYWKERNWFVAENADAFEQIGGVTHWMPLPPPPSTPC